jgi:hypothetical protein
MHPVARVAIDVYGLDSADIHPMFRQILRRRMAEHYHLVNIFVLSHRIEDPSFRAHNNIAELSKGQDIANSVLAT